jgi:DNA-binding SARP family transcriptional activator
VAADGLHVNVLGPLEVVGADGALTFGRQRERLLLALLAARAPAFVSTGQLVADLWSDEPPPGAATTLRSYVSSLRRGLRDRGYDGLVLTGRHGYALSAPASDQRRFTELVRVAGEHRDRGDRAAEAGALRRALGLWRGEALDEVASVPAIVPIARLLHEQRLLTYERWSDAELAIGRHAELAAALMAVCEAHPTRERLWAYRMRALYRSGAHADALEAYRELYRRLRDELGIEPSAELRALELAILRQDDSLEPDGADASPLAAATLPPALRAPRAGPFVGRRAELTAIDACAALTRAGASHLLVITGEPGAGKTRLAAEWAGRAAGHGWTVLYGRCDRDDTTPFQPFAEALGALWAFDGEGDRRPPPQAARGVGLASAITPHDTGDLHLARWRLFDAITEWVVTQAARAPLTLILDDLQWADASSLELLRHLARRAGQAALLVVVTCRTNGSASDAGLAELHADPGYKRVALAGLSEDEVSEMAGTVPGVDGRTSRGDLRRLSAELHRLTGGNPLLLRQSLVQIELAAPGRDGGAWPDRIRAALPAITDVIASRLELLSGTEGETLTVAAALGEEFALSDLEAVLGPAEDGRALDAIDAALQRHIIAAVPDAIERYRFSHDLLRQALLDRLSAPRRARLHGRIGDALAALPDDAGNRLISLAGHFAAAARPGHVERAAEFALRAGHHALTQLAFEQAAELAGRGLTCVAIDRGDASMARCELELLQAHARLQARDISGCKQAAERAGSDARALNAPEALARAAIVGSQLNTFGQSSPPTRRLCEDALAAIRDRNPILTAQVLAGFADCVASSEGDAPAASVLSAEALRLARGGGASHALSRALFVHADILEWSPRLREREALADELRALAIDTDDAQAEANALQVRALVRLERADVDGFDADVERIEQIRGRIGYWYTDMFALLRRGMRALLDDRLDDVEAHANALLGHARHEPNVVNLYMGQIFLLRREQQRLGELEAPLAAAVGANPGVASFRCALALAHAELGALDAARTALHTLSANRFAAVPRDATWTTSLTALADTAATVGAVESAAALIDLLRPYSGRLLVATKGMACLGAADRLLGRLLMVRGQFAEGERHLAAALELEGRTGSELLLARTRRAVADLAERTGAVPGRRS